MIGNSLACLQRPVASEEIMIGGTKFLLFLSAALILAVIQGPGILYVLGRTLNGGRREGITSALGTFFGGLVHAFAAAVGLSALLVASASAFQMVRYAGAAYLICLGITMIRTRHFQRNLRSAQARVGINHLYRVSLPKC